MCNLGLNVILSISVSILNAIYPISIVLILLGITHNLWKNNRFVYPFTVAGTGVISIICSLDKMGISLGFLSETIKRIPLYEEGFYRIFAALIMLFVGTMFNFF